MGSTVGKLFGNLQHTGVQSPSGETTFYPTPQAAAQAASAQLPSAASMIGGSPDNPTISTPSGLPVVKPETSTTKGNVLRMLISGGLGALAGTGGRDFGEGGFRAQAFFNNIADQQRRQQEADLLTQIRQQEIADQPARLALRGAQLENVQAETALHRKQLELAGKKEPRALNEVDLAILAAGPEGDPETVAAKKALTNLGRGPFAEKEPKTYDALVLASQLEDDPQKKARYDAAIAHIEKHRDRPTRTESEIDNDRRIRRDANLIAGQALSANNGKEDGALSFLTRTLAADHASGGKNLTDHERQVTATAILMLRHKTNPLDEILGTVLANQKKPE